MCKFIQFESPSGETVYLNVTSVSEARYDPQDNRLAITVGDPSGRSTTTNLTGKEATRAKAILDQLTK